MSKKEVTSQELLKATMLIKKKKMELEISKTLREDGPQNQLTGFMGTHRDQEAYQRSGVLI